MTTIKKATRLKVLGAASSLSERGIKPTVEKVRIELGDKGSYGTIAPLLREWKLRQKKSEQRAELFSSLVDCVDFGKMYKLIRERAISEIQSASCDSTFYPGAVPIEQYLTVIDEQEKTETALDELSDRYRQLWQQHTEFKGILTNLTEKADDSPLKEELMNLINKSRHTEQATTGHLSELNDDDIKIFSRIFKQGGGRSINDKSDI